MKRLHRIGLGIKYVATYVRFPWLNNVSTAVTMDSTTLLHFLSNTTIEAEMFRLLWRGDIKESWNEVVSGSLGLEESGRTRGVRSATDCNLGVVFENQ
jgi:hypothetical protein